MNISNWEDNIDDETKVSEYDSEITEEAARNRNVRQHKGLLDDRDNSITNNSRAKIITGSNSNNSNNNNGDTKPPWYLD